MNNMRTLLRYIGDYRRYFYLSLIFAALSALLLLVPYYSIYQLFKSLLTKQPFDANYYGFLAIGGIVLGIICYFTALWFSHLVGFRMEKNMRRFGAERLLNVPLAFFDQTESGKIRKTIDDNAGLTHSFVAHNLPDLVTTLITPIVVLTVLFRLSWVLGALGTALILASFYCIKCMMGNIENMKRYMTALEKMASEAAEFIRGMQIVKIFNTSLDSFRSFRKSITDYSDWALKYTFSGRVPYVINEILLQCMGLVLVLLLYPSMSRQPAVNSLLIDVMFCLLISSQLVLFLIKVLYTGENLTLAFQSIQRLEHLFNGFSTEKREEKETAGKMDIFDITCAHVTFSYDQKRTVLHDISFRVPEHSVTAIVGPSGSGKSTLAKLIVGMYQQYDGSIRIGGRERHDYSEEALMSRMTYVFQDTKLFKRSIRDNLLLANADANEAEIRQALQESQCEELINKLPQGLDTVIGTEGVSLSGGEQQRLALCRAFLKNDPIVILDEVTASIDPENEFKIRQAIERLVKNKTVIIIAHKLSLVETADQILVLNKGKLVEQGRHQDLVERNGLYWKMCELYRQSKNWKLKEGQQ